MLIGPNLGCILCPEVAAVMLVYYIAGWAILAGLFKIITAYRILNEMKGEWILKLSGLVSILVGVILMLRPEAEALTMALLIGILAVNVGMFQLLLGLKISGNRFQSKLSEGVSESTIDE